MIHSESTIQRTLYWKQQPNAVAMLPNYTPIGWHEADLWVVTKAMYAAEFEIKLTLADFRADQRKARKHRELPDRDRRRGPTRFFYVVPAGLVSYDDVPPYAGLIYVRDQGSLKTIRNAPRLRTSKVANAMLHHMGRIAQFRFWSERFSFQDYRRDTAQAKAWAVAAL